MKSPTLPSHFASRFASHFAALRFACRLALSLMFSLATGLTPNAVRAAVTPTSQASTVGTLSMKLGNDTLCLTPKNSEGKSWQYVDMRPCDGSASQNWALQSSGLGDLYITNAPFGDERNLRTYNGANSLALDSDKTTGYSTMRRWVVSYDADGHILLWNVYSKDAGAWKLINVNPQSKEVGLSVPDTRNEVKWTFSGDIPSPKRPVVGQNRRVLVLATHYNDVAPASADKLWDATLAPGDDKTFASLAHYVNLASRGKLTLSGKMAPDIDFGERPATCDSGAILKASREAAVKLGFNVGDFDFLFVDISAMRTCKWAGLAQTPGRWIVSNGVGYKYWMWAHEFGHNLGFGHATTLTACPVKDGVVQINDECKRGSGSDATDTMNGGGAAMYPVDYQLYAGWLEDSDVPMIKTSGTYTMKPLWQPGGPQGYRIQRADGSVLFLEFRQPRPGFESWSPDSPVVKGLTIHIATYGANTMTNTLVDATPETGTTADAQLMPGTSIYDALSGMTITLQSADSNGARIVVEHQTPTGVTSASERRTP